MHPRWNWAPEVTGPGMAGAQVQVVDFKDRGPGAKVMIEVHVIVEAASQRGIIIGAGGSAMKALGSAARVDIEEFLGALLFVMCTACVVPCAIASPGGEPAHVITRKSAFQHLSMSQCAGLAVRGHACRA